MKEIKLTDEQAEMLIGILSSHEDKGPTGEGWQSDELEELCEHIESQLQPRKTVSDAVDYFDGVWPRKADHLDFIEWNCDKCDYLFSGRPSQEDCQVCTREEFEAEVARRKGEEWTHIDAFGDPCRIIADKPDSHGNVVILRQEGWYASAAASSVKPIKPTLSKDEAWDKAVSEDVSPFYILENYEVK